MLDQGDILSLIVFNQTMNELPTSQKTSLATRAGTLAARALPRPLRTRCAGARLRSVRSDRPTMRVAARS
jgi:hypothetical protein